MLRELTNYIYDKNFKMIIEENKINIINYNEILIFEDETILLRIKDKTIKIKGNNLVINRLYNKELLIEGIIKAIELG